ncbi:hypothetical protein EXIGLDRAFT_395054 [Exidia glandulosa HHB12029]|uniref:Uncharacterized protein n=1 Tax=Exidia glandulosa HHB12029 TaxID=1314781 RepID=A0A165BPY0_EXIGL|nr:hypothetical protein EXIGLDRAFT_395054 [Exidia glandulosa HHB12029]
MVTPPARLHQLRGQSRLLGRTAKERSRETCVRDVVAYLVLRPRCSQPVVLQKSVWRTSRHRLQRADPLNPDPTPDRTCLTCKTGPRLFAALTWTHAASGVAILGILPINGPNIHFAFFHWQSPCRSLRNSRLARWICTSSSHEVSEAFSYANRR